MFLLQKLEIIYLYIYLAPVNVYRDILTFIIECHIDKNSSAYMDWGSRNPYNVSSPVIIVLSYLYNTQISIYEPPQRQLQFLSHGKLYLS